MELNINQEKKKKEVVNVLVLDVQKNIVNVIEMECFVWIVVDVLIVKIKDL